VCAVKRLERLVYITKPVCFDWFITINAAIWHCEFSMRTLELHNLTSQERHASNNFYFLILMMKFYINKTKFCCCFFCFSFWVVLGVKFILHTQKTTNIINIRDLEREWRGQRRITSDPLPLPFKPRAPLKPISLYIQLQSQFGWPLFWWNPCAFSYSYTYPCRLICTSMVV
jgi:hypothetical protein